MSEVVVREKAISLPPSVEGLMACRKIPPKTTLNDNVERIVLNLWEDVTFQKLIDATYHEQTVEGSIIADDLEAARMIRGFSTQEENAAEFKYVASQKLDTIRKSMNVVLRRYHMSRKERREG